jgi:hypothetical protein
MLLKGPFSMGKHLGFSFLSVAEKKLLKKYSRCRFMGFQAVTVFGITAQILLAVAKEILGVF